MTIVGASTPLLLADNPQAWLATHLTAHQSADDEDLSPGQRWVRIADLLADDTAHLRREHARMIAENGTPPAAAAKWLAGWFAGRLADRAGFVYAASAALLLAPEAARFRLHPDGWPDRLDPGAVPVAVVAGHPWAG